MASLTLYKFGLFLLLPVALVLQKRYRALAAYMIGAAVLAAGSAWLEDPALYVNTLRNLQDRMYQFDPASVFGLRGLFSGIGLKGGYGIACAVALIPLVLWRMRNCDIEEAFGLSLMAGILSAWYSHYYDAALLILPFGLALKSPDAFTRNVALAAMFLPLWCL